MARVTDLIITWPKTRELQSYLDECAKAAAHGLMINYRVGYPPARRDIGADARVYVVYDGAIRGWQLFSSVIYRAEDEVHGVAGDPDWPEGWYIVRYPDWHPCEEVPRMGFQGWRYYTRPADRPPA